MPYAKIHNQLVCKECSETIKRTIPVDRLTVDGDVHDEEWECPNGHDTTKVLAKNQVRNMTFTGFLKLIGLIALGAIVMSYLLTGSV